MWRGRWFALFVCTVGCGGGSVSTGSTQSFLTGLPSRQTLEVTAPSSHAPAALSERSSALIGETASLYVLTRQMTGQVNGFVGGALDTLGAISRTPPAAVGPDSAAWGPFTDALSPVAGRLVVVRVAPGAHTFRARPASEVRRRRGLPALPPGRLDRRRTGRTGPGVLLRRSGPRPPARPGRQSRPGPRRRRLGGGPRSPRGAGPPRGRPCRRRSSGLGRHRVGDARRRLGRAPLRRAGESHESGRADPGRCARAGCPPAPDARTSRPTAARLRTDWW